MDICFESLKECHTKAVVDIYNYYVENSFAAFPETALPYEAFGKILKMTQGYPAYVIKNSVDEEIVGFCFLRAYNSVPASVQITYFIASDAVGQGIGKKALIYLEDQARKQGVKNIFACTASLNEPSLAFHGKNGFVECERIKNIARKKGQAFDAVWMQKVIG